ncbi:PWWP domain-containing protein 2-like [Argentina anserina]|uniref:PWWP domain-containing protein 2-like n=1 Tax=Argentina anserina TaxID=57926 RepID=UPI0021766D79|nr:PWWP domain-containing protein 2-like [Potentilla anserina]
MDGNVSSGVNGKSCDLKMEFGVSDLVWGKVRTHPWWPGQICDPSDASELAKKCCKKGSYLIAYFGDQTFAWNEAPKIKPFLEHCSKMERQSDKEEFQNAVACALAEVSRRVEFGLACSCISKGEYAKLKTQKIVNAGIRKEACTRDGGDSSLGASFFEPAKVIKFMKSVAQLPYGKADRLEFVTSHAQLSAFRRWKSHVPLPEENVSDISFMGEKSRCNEASDKKLSVIEDEKLVPKSESKDNSFDEFKDISDSKTQKCLFPMSDSESEGKAGSELILQSCKKRKELDFIADEDVLPLIKDGKLVGILETKDNSLHKCWLIPGDGKNSSENEQNLSDLEGTICVSDLMSEKGSKGKGDGKLISQPSAKKRKEVDVMANDGALEHRKSDSSQEIGSNVNNMSIGFEEFFNMFLQR